MVGRVVHRTLRPLKIDRLLLINQNYFHWRLLRILIWLLLEVLMDNFWLRDDSWLAVSLFGLYRTVLKSKLFISQNVNRIIKQQALVSKVFLYFHFIVFHFDGFAKFLGVVKAIVLVDNLVYFSLTYFAIETASGLVLTTILKTFLIRRHSRWICLF